MMLAIKSRFGQNFCRDRNRAQTTVTSKEGKAKRGRTWLVYTDIFLFTWLSIYLKNPFYSKFLDRGLEIKRIQRQIDKIYGELHAIWEKERKLDEEKIRCDLKIDGLKRR